MSHATCVHLALMESSEFIGRKTSLASVIKLTSELAYLYLTTESLFQKRCFALQTFPETPAVAQVDVPGKSSHGWGLAVDLALFKKGTKNPITSQVIKPLCGNAAEFGFCWELDGKPWHLVYFPGDEM